MLKTTMPVRLIAREAVDYLSKFIHVDKAILFGSHAAGFPREDSDIDLAVFSDDFIRLTLAERVDLFSKAIMAVDARMEFHAFTKDDYDYDSGISFVRIVKETGILL